MVATFGYLTFNFITFANLHSIIVCWISGIVWSRHVEIVWLYSTPFYRDGRIGLNHSRKIWNSSKHMFLLKGFFGLQIPCYSNRFWSWTRTLFEQWQKIVGCWLHPNNALASFKSRWTFTRIKTQPDDSCQWSTVNL